MSDALSPSRETVVDNWKPKHDRVLLLHIAGYEQKTIAEMVGYHPTHVSSLLNDPRADERVEHMRERMYDRLEDDIVGKMKLLGPLAVDNIEETLQADHDPGSRSKKHQDKMSFELLDKLGHGEVDTERTSGPTLEERDAERLSEALEKSAEVAERIHEVEGRVKENGDGFQDSDEEGDQ